MFGNVFERCFCVVLMKHRRKVKGEQVIIFQMAQQLKPKKWQTHCIDDQDKFQSVTDTDNEFTECQTPRKKLQSIGISPVSLHAFMKTLKSNISEAYKVQVDCLKDFESDSYDKNYMKEKLNDLVRLHEAMQEKLKTASYSEQIQVLTLVPDRWSQMYCSE